VNKLLDQFREMQKMIKKMAKGGMKPPPSMFGMR
jgi:signal recognition particle GTPase